ncbi:hypothetical protein B7494_g7784 [Chlorociboria aeruginascens]|nr:hypothetical protein B7494_g7784 [Chlorociboria aeruginascens]
MRSSFFSLSLFAVTAVVGQTYSNISTSTSYWLEQIQHQGVVAFSAEAGSYNSSSYQVFRNVKDFGAKGDGITDDTVAINRAMSYGDRCAPGSCNSSTTSPAIVYFPAGTYIISKSIIDYYFTQVIGNPNDLPILKAAANFSGDGLIDGDPYGSSGNLDFGSTNVFYRQIRNMIFDLQSVPFNKSTTGVHWPTAQATSLQNCAFWMTDVPGTQQQGIFIESGSGGYMGDLVFYGGIKGAAFGNQQFTVRNLTFYNAVTAINQLWDWGWTYIGVSVINCTTGLNMTAGGAGDQAVGSVTFIDSTFTNTGVAFATAHNSTSIPASAGSLILDNVHFSNVPVAVQGPQGTVLPGGNMTVTGWGQGHSYTANATTNFQKPITAFSRPQSLTTNGDIYTRSKPQYEAVPLTKFISIRSQGAKGDGQTDDTVVINTVLKTAASLGQIVFFDAGTYKVTSTIYIPPGSKIVGESYSVIMGSGAFFSSITAPQPIISVGLAGETGIVEWSDMVVSTQGATAGAILIEWNLASPEATPSGMWDVHARIGGFAGSELQLADCPITPSSSSNTTTVAPYSNTTSTSVNTNCIAAFLTMHITPSASGLYLENNWFWTADHDIEDPSLTQITIYTGRGILCESTAGNIWLVGTAVEHHSLYQYQFVNTKNIFAGQVQTETAYYQPAPDALTPFTALQAWNDPVFTECTGGKCAEGWGVRVVESRDIGFYGVGLYSFFDNYSTACSAVNSTSACQSRIFSIEGNSTKDINIYNLNTIGSTNMITRNGVDLVQAKDNVNVFPDTIAYFSL